LHPVLEKVSFFLRHTVKNGTQLLVELASTLQRPGLRLPVAGGRFSPALSLLRLSPLLALAAAILLRTAGLLLAALLLFFRVGAGLVLLFLIFFPAGLLFPRLFRSIPLLLFLALLLVLLPVLILLLLLLLFLALLTKRTLVFTILWVGLVATLYVGYRRQWAMKRIVIAGLAVVLFITIGLAWVILNPQVLDNSIINMFNINIAKQFAVLYLVERGASLPEILELYIKSGLFAFITFWGNFGGATTNIPWPWAWSLMAVCAVVLFGAGRYLYKAFTPAKGVSSYQKNVFIIFIAGIALSLLNAFFPVLVAGPSWGPPARYFFPMIIPIATFLFLGTWHLFPAKYRQVYLLPLWLAALVTYDALVISRVLIPFLYG